MAAADSPFDGRERARRFCGRGRRATTCCAATKRPLRADWLRGDATAARGAHLSARQIPWDLDSEGDTLP